ncbi:MAG: DUF309 domain-containing protein [Myxococcota bacterium]
MADPPELLPGLLAYRAGRYFEAHERWEERWRAEDDGDRRLMAQALVQLAGALHKWSTGIRPGGAPALLARCEAKLARLEQAGARPFGLDPGRLRRGVRRLAEEGPQGELRPPALP